jgi:hypothetical protein
MRAFAVLILLAGVARADTTPPGAPPTPKPGTAEWKRVDRAITGYCAAPKSESCACFLAELHRRPPNVDAIWTDEGHLILGVDAYDAIIQATLRFDGGRWFVLSVECRSTLTPKLD